MFPGAMGRPMQLQPDPRLMSGPGMAFIPGLLPVTGTISPMALLDSAPPYSTQAAFLPAPSSIVSSGPSLADDLPVCPVLIPPKWHLEKLVNFNKNLYTSSGRVRSRNAVEVEEFLKMKGVDIYGESLPRPCQAFEDVECVPEALLQGVKTDFPTLDPLAGMVWPVAMMGRDTVVIGARGMRSMAAYTIPLLQHINAQPRLQPGDGPIVLILCPTKELAESVQETCTRYGTTSGIKNTAIIGGIAKGPQIRNLAKGVEIVIGTPGRLCDLIASNAMTLTRITLVVIDEADRMLDMGYADHLRQMLRCIRPDRQTLIFAGAVTPFVKELCSLCQSLVEIRVGNPDRVAEVRQHWHFINGTEQSRKRTVSLVLNDILDRRGKALVYTADKAQADALTFQFRQHGYPALVVPEEQDVEQRKWVLNEFVLGNSPILVADDHTIGTLEVPGLQLAISYQLPVTMEQYLQRLHRLCRPEGCGEHVNLVAPQDSRLAPALVRFLEEGHQPIPPPLLDCAKQPSASATKMPGTSESPALRPLPTPDLHPAAPPPLPVMAVDRLRDPLLTGGRPIGLALGSTSERLLGSSMGSVYPASLPDEPVIDRTGPIIYEQPSEKRNRSSSGSRRDREKDRVRDRERDRLPSDRDHDRSHGRKRGLSPEPDVVDLRRRDDRGSRGQLDRGPRSTAKGGKWETRRDSRRSPPGRSRPLSSSRRSRSRGHGGFRARPRGRSKERSRDRSREHVRGRSHDRRKPNGRDHSPGPVRDRGPAFDPGILGNPDIKPPPLPPMTAEPLRQSTSPLKPRSSPDIPWPPPLPEDIFHHDDDDDDPKGPQEEKTNPSPEGSPQPEGSPGTAVLNAHDEEMEMEERLRSRIMDRISAHMQSNTDGQVPMNIVDLPPEGSGVARGEVRMVIKGKFKTDRNVFSSSDDDDDEPPRQEEEGGAG